MPIHLLIAPPASGKTQACLDLVKTAAKNNTFAEIWFLVPDQIQADAARRRIAAAGQTLAVRVATFQELNEEILDKNVHGLPVASKSMLHRLLREVIRTLQSEGKIAHYASICDFPGFHNEIHARIAELERALITPQSLLEVAQAQEDFGLVDLAVIYAAYQARLRDLGWTDLEGLSTYALEALTSDPALLTGIVLLVVDGFDNFDTSQMRMLQAAAGRAKETWITLPGLPQMDKPSHQRFATVVRSLASSLPLTVQTLSTPPHLPPTLLQLEKLIFEAPTLTFHSGNDLQRVEARSPVEEAREALRWLKALVVRDGLPLSACGIAVPDVESYRVPLQDAADEFGIPIQFNQGELLSKTPLGAAVSDLLNLASQDYPLRVLLDTVRSPYFSLAALGLQPSDAKLLEIASRYGQVVRGLAQWEETLRDLSAQGLTQEDTGDLAEEETAIPRLPTGALAERLLGGLRYLSERLSPPNGTMSYKQWAFWLQDLLESLGFFTYLITAGETALCSVFDRLLLDMASCEALTGDCPANYAAFLNEWEGMLRVTYRQDAIPGTSRPAIRAMPLMEARGTRCDSLAILGMAEGVFPAVERTDPFLREEVRLALGMEPRLGQEQAGLFYQLVTRADRNLLLTRPYLAKDGEIWEPSPYWNAIQELLLDKPLRIHPDEPRSLSEAASPAEMLFWAARRWSQTGSVNPTAFSGWLGTRWQHISETQSILAGRLQKEARGMYDGDLSELSNALNQRYGEVAEWSASRLESYASCPFAFLVSYALGLEVLEPPQIGYQANQLGSILHAVLEQVYPEVPEPADTAQVLAHLPEVAWRIFEAAPKKYHFRPSPLWETQQADLLRVLEATVQGIAALDPDQHWRPLAFEADFGKAGQLPLVLHTPSGDVRLHGQVDRIDINPQGNLRVIDYKSGSSHLASQDLIDGRRLQLPIYALAASQALGLGEPVEGFYWKLFQQEPSALKLSRFQSANGTGAAAAVTLATGHIEAIVTHIRQGFFQPVPPQGGCPSYCVAASWCWHYKGVKH